MKKVFIFLTAVLVLASCKNTEKPSSEAQEITADFIYLNDAAVLKGDTFIYGVKIDQKAKELAEKVKPIQTDEFDMVKVVVKGTLTKKEENQKGWEDIVTIKEIISVGNTPSQPDVKLE